MRPSAPNTGQQGSGTKPTLLIADACVLIDLAKADGLCFVEDLIRLGLADIVIPRAVLEETVRELTNEEVFALGVKMVTPTFPESIRMTELGESFPMLSLPDRTLFALAESRHYVIWTNDDTLRRKSKAQGVVSSWCFEQINRLVEYGFRSADEVLSVAQKVEATNERQVGLASRVKAKLEKISEVMRR